MTDASNTQNPADDANGQDPMLGDGRMPDPDIAADESLATPTSSSADDPDVDPADLGATGGFTDATDTTPEGTPAADG